MNIIHIAPNAVYNEGWSYQENLLTKYQAKLGHKVTLIVPNLKFEGNKIIKTSCEEYESNDGYRVIRSEQLNSKIFKLGKVLLYLNVYEILKELRPDFIFYHGMISSTILQVVKYKKNINKECIIVQDNHLDYNIGYNPHTLKGMTLSIIYSVLYKITNKYISKVYGVTPWRKKYAEKFFNVPKRKTDVLIMGADDENIDFLNKNQLRKDIRKHYDIKDDDFLIVSGGKIDEKKKIHLLMNAVNEIDSNIKLLIFGNVDNDIKETFYKQLSNKIIYINWIDSKDVYKYFFAADLVVFPGQHSVLWEQACASKTPCVFGKWEGMEHVNNGGNASFIYPINVKEIKKIILELKFTKKYFKMKEIADSSNTDIYLYSNIAQKSLECLKNDEKDL